MEHYNFEQASNALYLSINTYAEKEFNLILEVLEITINANVKIADTVYLITFIDKTEYNNNQPGVKTVQSFYHSEIKDLLKKRL